MKIEYHINRLKEAKEFVQWIRTCGVKIWRETIAGHLVVALGPPENITQDMMREVERLRPYLLMFLTTGEPMQVNPWMRSRN